MRPSDVSCVIPFGGNAKNLPLVFQYLKDALQSALRQGFAEIIVVNDGNLPEDLSEVAGLPNIRLIHLDGKHGAGSARNAGIRACKTPYLVMLDGDDLFCPRYLETMIAWVEQKRLRCAAASLRYVGHDSKRLGRPVSMAGDAVVPSGFFTEVTLIAEAGGFPLSLSEDLLFFRSLNRVTPVLICPEAQVLYRVHIQSDSSTRAVVIWSFNQLIPFIDSGTLSLEQANDIATVFAERGIVPPGLEGTFSGVRFAMLRQIGRSGYACWLNRSWVGVLQHGIKLLPYLSELWPTIRRKWVPASDV